VKVLEELILPALEELPQARSMGRSADAPLFGAGSPLDSIGLVTLLVDVEGRIEEKLGLSVTIADEKAMSRSASPFRTLGSLAQYVGELIGHPDHRN
jgi:hypothetical protein